MVQSPEEWHLFFDARSSSSKPGATTIGHAESTNGINWTITPDKPLLEPSGILGWESYANHAPEVITHDGDWYMLFAGAFLRHHYQTGLAKSHTATGEWKKHHTNPVIGFGDGGNPTANQTRAGPIGVYNNNFHTLVDGKDAAESPTGTFLFSSKNLVQWEYEGELDIVLETSPWERFVATGGMIIYNSDVFLLGEGTHSSTQKRMIGLAKTENIVD